MYWIRAMPPRCTATFFTRQAGPRSVLVGLGVGVGVIVGVGVAVGVGVGEGLAPG